MLAQETHYRPAKHVNVGDATRNTLLESLARALLCGQHPRSYIDRSRTEPELLKINDIEPRHYRDAMAHFAGAVHVVTTDGPAGRRGVTVIAACSVSDKPPTVLVCLNRENANNDLFRDNGVFALNTLAAGHENLANAFSGLTGLSQDERFALGAWETLSSGAPTLAGAIAVFDCELADAKDLATHRVYFGRVTGLRLGANLRPLVYHDRNYRVL